MCKETASKWVQGQIQREDPLDAKGRRKVKILSNGTEDGGDRAKNNKLRPFSKFELQLQIARHKGKDVAVLVDLWMKPKV